MATVYRPLGIGAAIPHATLIPELVKIDGTNFPLFGWAFDAATDEQLSWRFKASNYGSGNLTLILDWYSRAGSTTNEVRWGAALSVLTPGDAQSMETDALATENTVDSTVNGTPRGLTRATITISNLDSLANNDSVELRVRRVGSNAADDMAGDAVLVGLEVQYSDT